MHCGLAALSDGVVVKFHPDSKRVSEDRRERLLFHHSKLPGSAKPAKLSPGRGNEYHNRDTDIHQHTPKADVRLP
jgi:hypothetical protein